MAKLVAFPPAIGSTLRQIAEERGRSPAHSEVDTGSLSTGRVQARCIIGKIGSAITARSGATASSGTLTIWELDPSDGSLAATSDTVTVWNLAEVAVPDDTDNFIVAERDLLSTEWIIITEMCASA